MNEERRGEWVYIMADRHRGALSVGVTSDLATRTHQHRKVEGPGLVWAQLAPDIRDCIAHEKRVKRWRREWKFALIERGNPEWLDLSDRML